MQTVYYGWVPRCQTEHHAWYLFSHMHLKRPNITIFSFCTKIFYKQRISVISWKDCDVKHSTLPRPTEYRDQALVRDGRHKASLWWVYNCWKILYMDWLSVAAAEQPRSWTVFFSTPRFIAWLVLSYPPRVCPVCIDRLSIDVERNQTKKTEHRALWEDSIGTTTERAAKKRTLVVMETVKNWLEIVNQTGSPL